MFGSKNDFEEGDIFHSFYDNKFHLYKLLKFDKEIGTFHVLSYTALDALPEIHDLRNLEVQIYHAPIDKSGFDNPVLVDKQPVTSGDLIGYHEYLRQTHDVEFIVYTAKGYYQQGYALTDEKNYDLAIDAYSKAIDLVPQFYEAIDNRAFCKMNLANWKDAIKDFELSLTVNPVSLLAEFSIGECYLRLGDGKRAKEQFEKCIRIDPDDRMSHDFLKKAIELSGGY